MFSSAQMIMLILEVQIARGTDIHHYVDDGKSEAMTGKGVIVLGHEGSGIRERR
jgi:threonine dehydrogenase-like Zn-dependent dehydrogenase